MRVLTWSDLSDAEREAALARPAAQTDARVIEAVAGIVARVGREGDAAIRDYTASFDGVELESFRVDLSEAGAAWAALPAADRKALRVAKANIAAFHAAQTPQVIELDTLPGVTCRRRPQPIQTCGLYVPGGTAPLVSTVLMLAVPAQVAGVPRRVVVSPPGPDGTINAGVLAAAHLAGVTDIFAVGGAQAIAGLAFGTATLPRCDKIFGPGNAYVAAAKARVSQMPGGPAIDLPAGPSEAMVVADETTDPAFAAADFLAQAEHDRMAQVVAVCSTRGVADAIVSKTKQQLARLSRRDIAEAALAEARIIIAEDAAAVINSYAPEHLILLTADAEGLAARITRAGSVFIGPWTPESVGDYASGTNHTLPTGGAARAYSGVQLESFYTFISEQRLTRAGLATLGPVVERMADMEGLDAHRNAVSIRLAAAQ